MGRELNGRSLPLRAVFFSVFALLFIGFVVLAVVSVSLVSSTLFPWILVGSAF